MLCSDKCYRAEIMLGTVTDTLDITGGVISKKPVNVGICDIDKALEHFTGAYMQTPPMFSAIKSGGTRLYDIARKGGNVDIPPRKVTVFTLKRESDIGGDCRFTVFCKVSKGTYIRSLCRDIGEYLGTGAVLTRLERTETSGFSVSDCVALDELCADNVAEYVLPADRAVAGLRSVLLTKAQAFRFSNGGSISFDCVETSGFSNGETVRIYQDGVFLGLAVAETASGTLKFKCIINPFGKE